MRWTWGAEHVQRLPRYALLAVTIPVGAALLLSLVLQIVVLGVSVPQSTLIAYIAWALSVCALWIAPQAGAVVALGGAALSGFTDLPVEASLLVVVFAGIMSVSARLWCRRAYLMLAVLWAGITAFQGASADLDFGPFVWWALCIGGAYLVGGLLRRTYERQQEAEERAASVAVAIEAARESERRALAHELHDSLGHELTLIRMHSEAAGLTDASEQQAQALRAISEASGSAMADLHHVVVLLQEQPTGDSTGLSSALPEILDRCLAELRESGHRPELTVRGDPEALGLVLQHDLGRLIQEAVTNVFRHGAASQAGEPDCWITLDVGETVDLTVTNRLRSGPHEGPPIDDTVVSGTGSSGTGTGSMEWRARKHGGTFHAGRVDDGCWRVEVRGLRAERSASLSPFQG